jgi:hypothetical protein
VTRHMADKRRRITTRLAEMRQLAHQRRHGHRRRREGGQILVLFTMAIIVIMLFASIVIDLGMLRNNRQILVNAVDAAALAGGTKLPIDGCLNPTPQSATAACNTVNVAAVNAMNALVTSTLTASYPGITGANYTISYRCLIGVTSSNQPYVSRDVPVVCNPRHAGSTPGSPGADHNVTAADFRGAGITRYAYCYPHLGDKCNVVVVEGATTTAYTFGRVAGVNSGSTGTVASAACNGPCGQPPAAPVDLVIIIDRTGSMLNPDKTQTTKDAANAILGVYDPTVQRIALGLLGPSKLNETCSGANGGPAVAVNVASDFTLNTPSTGTSNTWVREGNTPSGGAGSIQIFNPDGTDAGDLLVAAITVSGGTGVRVAGNTSTAQPGHPSTGNPNVPGSTPTGWTLIRRMNSTTNISLLTYYKVATVADESVNSYTWTLTPNARASGAIVRYTGVDPANPINVNGLPGSGSGNSLTAPSVNTDGNQVAIVGFFATANGSGSGSYFGNPNNGMNETFEIRHPNSAGPSLGGVRGSQSSQGSTGTTTVSADGNGQWLAQHIGLTPVPVDTYGTNPATDLAKWIPIGFSGTDTDAPAPAYFESYSNGLGVINPTTHLASAIDCHDAAGYTNLATPIAMATYYLQHYGRPHVTWGILLETDGYPQYGGTGDPGNYTCQQSVANAAAAKAVTNADGKPIQLFTVGFGLDGANDNNCPDGFGSPYRNVNVTKALSDMATPPDQTPTPDGVNSGCVPAENTDQDHFFCSPKTSDLETTFKTIATQLAGDRSHLVQLDPLPAVYSLSPSTGPCSAVINVTGKYFTGVTSVKFGGVNVGYTFNSDTSIRINNCPAGAPGTFDIIVTTPGGSSIVHSGSKFNRT